MPSCKGRGCNIRRKRKLKKWFNTEWSNKFNVCNYQCFLFLCYICISSLHEMDFLVSSDIAFPTTNTAVHHNLRKAIESLFHVWLNTNSFFQRISKNYYIQLTNNNGWVISKLLLLTGWNRRCLKLHFSQSKLDQKLKYCL